MGINSGWLAVGHAVQNISEATVGKLETNL